jgi:hypothetical protein
MQMPRYTVPVLLLFIHIFALMASAQETTATLYGSVSDTSRAVIAGARVSATSEATGFRRETLTNSDGNYILPLLPVGVYELAVEASGFKRHVQKGITLTVNQNGHVNVQMSVGSVSEVLQVTGEASQVNIEQAAVSQVINQRTIQELPLNGRNFLQLATLQAGVTPGIGVISEFTPAHKGQVNFSVNGLRQQSNNFLLDGADNNDGFLGTASGVPSPDALQEFRILTNGYSAEYGRGGGAQVNIVTRSGTNSFHGSAYEYLRNDVFDARNFFSAEVPKLRQNQFGGTLGGPIIRNRTFFFGSYEGFRRRQGVTNSSVVPTAAQRRGDFTGAAPIKDPNNTLPCTTADRRGCFADNKIPDSRISPIAKSVMALLPEPNRGGNQLAVVRNGTTDTNQLLVRADHQLSAKNNLSARYFYDYGSGLKPFSNPPPVNVPGFEYKDEFGFQNLIIADTHNFTPRLLNEARVAWSRTRTLFNQSQSTVTPASLGFTYPVGGKATSPLISISGFTSIGTVFETDGLRRDNIYQLQDHLTWLAGRHSLRMGADVFFNQYSLRQDNSNSGNFNFNGGITGNGLADFLLGLANRYTQANAGEPAYFSSVFFQPYVQDDFKIHPRLTLNLGLRREMNGAMSEERDRLVAFRPGQKSTRVPNAPTGLLFEGDPGVERIIRTDKNNFAPRVGFAWDVFGDGRTSLRGGYGIYYDVVLATLYGNFVVSVPYSTTVTVSAPRNFADPFNGSSPFAGGASNPGFPNLLPLTVIDPDYVAPYNQQWNLTVQREIAKDLVFELGYLGTKGTHLPGTRVLNTAEFRNVGTQTPNSRNIDQRRPFGPAFGTIYNYQSTVNSNYHSMQATANKRFSQGFSFLAAYTWSRAIDNGSYPTGRRAVRVGTLAQDQNNLFAERGLSNLDTRHRFVLSGLWELPLLRARQDVIGRVLGGWQLNGILQLQTGKPFVIQDSSDPNVDGVSSDKPDVIRNPNLDQRTVDRFFDTTAFVRVAANTNRFGNAGRNIVIGPDYKNLDLSLFKSFRLTEKIRTEFRWEIFNVLNHPNFDNPGGGAPANDIASPVFGRLQSTVTNNERIMQFALRIAF